MQLTDYIFENQFIPQLIGFVREDYQNIKFLMNKPLMRVLAEKIFDNSALYHWDEVDVEAKKLNDNYFIIYSFPTPQPSLSAYGLVIAKEFDNQTVFGYYLCELSHDNTYKFLSLNNNEKILISETATPNVNLFIKSAFEDFSAVN